MIGRRRRQDSATPVVPEADGPPPILPAVTCRAPKVAMHLSFFGRAQPCCMNGDMVYGDIRASTIRELWDGQARQMMADALDDGAYPIGCEGCAVEQRLGRRDGTPAQVFDQFPDEDQPWPLRIEFNLSNRCNLQCIQCNGENSSTIRAKREKRPPLEQPYGDEFFADLPPFLEHVEVVTFLGGEPFLMPDARRIWDLIIDLGVHPRVEVTTNATVWNERVARYVDGLRMSIAVSMDGATAETYEAVRVGASHARVVENRDRLLAATRRHGGTFQLNYCLLPANIHEAGLFALQGDELDVPVNFIPVHEPKAHSLFALPPDELRPVVQQLRSEQDRLAPRLGRNRDAFAAVVDMLGAQLERLDGQWDRDDTISELHDELTHWVRERRRTSDIAVRLPSRYQQLSADDLAKAEAELAEWAGRPAIALDWAAGVIVRVDVPEWAGWLLADEWVGARIESLSALLAERIGPVDLAPPVPWEGDFLESLGTAHHPSGDVHVRSLAADPRSRLYVAVQPCALEASWAG